jgi:hypothetical protein
MGYLHYTNYPGSKLQFKGWSRDAQAAQGSRRGIAH